MSRGVILYISGYTEDKSHDAMVSGFSGALAGRDDSIEAPDARRLFQTVTRSETFSPKTGSKDSVNGICLRRG